MIDVTVFVNDTFVSPAGSRYRDVYTPKVNRNTGIITLVVSGKEDLQSYINSFRSVCDMQYFVDRFNLGDFGAIQRANPVFLDVVGAPKSLAEAYELNVRGEAAFNNLPVAVREKFGNNYFRFISDAGSDAWYQALGMEQVKVDPAKDGATE